MNPLRQEFREPVRAAARWAGLAALLLSAACANNTAGPITKFTHIKVDGVEYPTSADALEAVRRDTRNALQSFARTPEPVKGRGRIIVPTTDGLRPLVAQQFQQSLKRPLEGEALDLTVAERQIELRGFADALVKTGIFETIDIREQSDLRDPDIGDADYLVWYQVRTTFPDNTGPWVGHWLIRRAGSGATQPIVMTGKPGPLVTRYIAFINGLRDGVQRVNGITVAGVAGKPGAAGSSVISVASGFVVGARGAILTNEHAVHVCPKLNIMDSDHQNYDGTVVATDAANDLALVRADHSWSEMASFRDGHDPRPGDPVVVTGYPLSGIVGSEMAVTTGSITALAGLHDDSRMMQFSAPIQVGNSGGPVFDGSGHVIGVVRSTLNGIALAAVTGAVPQNVNFAVKAAIIRNFLATHEVTYPHAAAGHELTPADIGDLARKFTVRLECRRR